MTARTIAAAPSRFRIIAAASAAAVVAATAAGHADAQAYRQPTGGGLGSIVNCDAPGGKQQVGAIVGAMLGGMIGANNSKNEATGAALGAGLGAAGGSWVGCKMQRDAAAAAYAPAAVYNPAPVYAPAPAYAPAPVRNPGYGYDGGYGSYGGHGGYDGSVFVAHTTVNIRSGPSTGARQIGRLSPGQRFEAVGQSGQWVMVRTAGRAVGYVHSAYVGPEHGRYGGRF